MTDTLYRESWKNLTAEEITATKRVQQLNDRLRMTGPHRKEDMIVLVGDLAHAETELQLIVLHQARAFNAFTEDNDPYGEHDCASFQIPVGLTSTETFMFKIDYYDPNLEFASNDASDPAITRRVMSLMYARDR